MIRQFLSKVKESVASVLPVSIIVLILSLTPLVNLGDNKVTYIITFVVCSFIMIIGISLFNLGADMAMQPMGEQVGSSLIKSKRIKLILIICFIMGLLITIAEPDLSVLAGQVSKVVNNWVLIISIGVGVGIFLLIAVLKIIFKMDLNLLLMFFYLMAFAVALLVAYLGNGDFLALSFDSGGVTTGPITVPFIMALGVGIATTIGGRNSKQNSFGLVSLCSIGPILVVLLLGITISPTSLAETAAELNTAATSGYDLAENVFKAFGMGILHSMKEVAIALSLVVAFFLIIELIFIKLPKTKLIQIFIGIAYTFFGLVLFLTAASIGFLPMGYQIGNSLADNPPLVIIFGFILGLVVVLAEPAVHVLTKQVEELTTGSISKKTMLIALSIGVGISICLSMVRIVCGFSIIYYIIPGYLISLGLSLFVPKMYTAIAFDSGGVASGPLTSSFILPFAIGACVCLGGNVLSEGFGIVSMVAMTPLITIQLLGFKSIITNKIIEKRRLKQIISADDEQIINFM